MTNSLFSPIKLGVDYGISCIDGRPFSPIGVKAQMLGGTINPLIVAAIAGNSEFDESFIRFNGKRLLDGGVSLGVHRGSHAHNQSSDCGFADRLVDIIKTAKENIDIITKRILEVTSVNGLDLENEILIAREKLLEFDESNIKISANELVTLLEQIGASMVEMQGDHDERACFVNLVTDTTHDMNEAGEQIFNLDLWEVMREGKMLGIAKDMIIGITLILYVATEMVLVEAKGKLALEVFLNKQ